MMGERISAVLPRLAFVLAVLLLSVPMYAQGGSVKVVLSDEKTGAPVGFATVSLIEDGTAKAYKYVLSTAEGVAEFTGVKKGSFKLKAELMGYKTYEVAVKIEGKAIDLGTVKMGEDVQVLDAAKVSAVGNPIVVKKDTIEYNASSFKTTDNDMLEELLKKLPGVEVGSDGSITANGETITKITIDGKTFFLDDPQLASKNIPAKIIEKVKVVEKKSEQAQFTGIDDGEEETVIDLSLRPGMMKGWFGNVQAGGGHDLQQAWQDGDWRYQGAAMVGRFTDRSQLSIILNGNNTNNRGFNDMAGSMMSSMRGGGMGRGTGGWGGNSGITTSWMGGVNGAWTLLDGDMDLGGNYLYNGSMKSLLEKSDKITYLDNGDQLIYNNGGPQSYGRNNGYGYSNTNTQGHRFGVRLEHKFSKNTSIIFEPQVNFGNGSYSEYSDFTTRRLSAETGDTLMTNDGFNSTMGNNRNWSTSGFLLFRQRFGKPGRTISANVRYSFSGNSLRDALNQSMTRNYDEAGNVLIDENGNPVADIVNQRIDRVSNSQSINARVSYTEPLGHDLYLEASYNYNWARNYSDKDAYNSGLSGSNPFVAGWGGYVRDDELPDPTFSSEITNISQNHNAGLNLQYQKGKLRVQVGASMQPTTTHNRTEANQELIDTTYTVWNWAPQAMLSYEFNDNSEIRFFYRGRSSQPSTSQLMPVPDNSDPLNVSFGNPYLKPYFNHNLRGHFGYTNKQTFFSIRGRFGAGIVQNPITSALWYGDNGAQYTMPLNGPASGNGSIDFFLNSPIAKSNFSIMNFFRSSYSQSASYIGKTALHTEDYYDHENAVFNYDQFNADFFNHSAAGSRKLDFDDYFTTNTIQNVNFTERLSLKYTCDIVELNLGGRTTYNKSWYTVQASQKARWNNQANFSMNWTIPGGVNLSSDINYNWYRGYTTPQEDEYVWNAEISKLLFKNQFTLSLKAYDILNQSKNLSITDASNYHQEIRNNTLGRYIILSLTYRFGNFGKAGQNMRRGSGGPGGGPMGPPPGR
ncbi:MAG: outer membrane beta-barrel protein [Clostridium sp.]|nr:outer membrane beta-barrel protein [Clostridium sp.]